MMNSLRKLFCWMILFSRLSIFFVGPSFSFVWAEAAAAAEEEVNYYEVLGIGEDSTLMEIKKAYRRLALEKHPDRNKGNERQAEVEFRRIGRAYEILSNDEDRRQYDAALRHEKRKQQHYRQWEQKKQRRSGGGGGGGGGHETTVEDHSRDHARAHASAHARATRDAFDMFDDLFTNDPFFQDALRNMDQLFAETFSKQQQAQKQQQHQQPRRSWGEWIADQLGIDFTITKMTTSGNANSKSSSTYHHRSSGHAFTTSLSSVMSTTTTIENGNHVLVQSMKQNGNQIEEKYINSVLVERRVNGVQQNLPAPTSTDL